MAARRRNTGVFGHVALFPCLAQLALACQPSFPVHFPLGSPPEVSCPLPVDDTQAGWPSRGSPWTHPPECEHSADRTSKYCVYTNSDRGSRGWSIITSPEIAAESAAFLRKPLNTSLLGNSHEAPYKIVDIPGKGKGVVATRAIKQYEEIMVDYATILVDIAFPAKVPASLGYRLLHAAVGRLSDPSSVLELEKSNGHSRDDVENILRTNSFHTPVGGVPHIALYPTVSRINHSCKPNAYTRFMTETLQVAIGATRAIQPGEEITISYITLGQPTPSRTRALYKKWGFTCTCTLCAASASERDASDARRQQIETLREQAVRAFQAGKPWQALRFTRDVVSLLGEEGLEVLVGEQYENMARIFWVLGKRANAERYGRLAVEVEREMGGGEEGGLEGMFRRFEEEEGPVKGGFR